LIQLCLAALEAHRGRREIQEPGPIRDRVDKREACIAVRDEIGDPRRTRHRVMRAQVFDVEDFKARALCGSGYLGEVWQLASWKHVTL